MFSLNKGGTSNSTPNENYQTQVLSEMAAFNFQFLFRFLLRRSCTKIILLHNTPSVRSEAWIKFCLAKVVDIKQSLVRGGVCRGAKMFISS